MNRLANTSCAAAIVATVAAFGAAPLLAGDITAEWANVTPPPAPELKQATVDPKTTALLVLDFGKNNCGVRPRCLANVPNVKKLIDEARTHNMMVAYTLPGQDAAGLVDQSLAPRPGEFLIQGSGGADKFIRSNLDQGLKDKGIKTVIVTGTSAQGAVAGCESAPKWDPGRFRHRDLIFRWKSGQGLGPDRRRSGPHLKAEIASYSNSLW